MGRSQICSALAILALFFFSSALADDVVVLTEENFDKEIGQDRAALVEFYAPWFVHICETFFFFTDFAAILSYF